MVYCSVASTDLQAHSTTAIQCDAYGQVSPFSNYTGSEPAIVHILTRKPAHKILITTRVSCIPYISSTVQTGGVGDHLILKIFRGFREIMSTGRGEYFFRKASFACTCPSHSAPFVHRKKSALGLARFSGHGCSRLPPRFGRLGLPDGFSYYMEGRWQGHRQVTVHDLGTVQVFNTLGYCIPYRPPETCIPWCVESCTR